MILVGIDCAIKSLALTISLFTNDKLNLVHCAVHDLFEKKNTKTMKNIDNIIVAKKLKSTLSVFDKLIDEHSKLNHIDDVNILIEFQCGMNIKSKTIFSYCLYHYCDLYNVHIIYPTLKTKYSFNNDLSLGVYMEKYMSNYTAQKNCCKNNFLFWLNENKLMGLIKNIKKKNIDDVADSFMMCYNWCQENKL